jgi:hypothetical protein
VSHASGNPSLDLRWLSQKKAVHPTFHNFLIAINDSLRNPIGHPTSNVEDMNGGSIDPILAPQLLHEQVSTLE